LRLPLSEADRGKLDETVESPRNQQKERPLHQTDQKDKPVRRHKQGSNQAGNAGKKRLVEQIETVADQACFAEMLAKRKGREAGRSHWRRKKTRYESCGGDSPKKKSEFAQARNERTGQEA
jgi:hypothetical protein